MMASFSRWTGWDLPQACHHLKGFFILYTNCALEGWFSVTGVACQAPDEQCNKDKGRNRTNLAGGEKNGIEGAGLQCNVT